MLVVAATTVLMFWVSNCGPGRDIVAGERPVARRVIVSMAVFPWFILVGISLIRPVLVPRYLLFTVPFLAVGLACAATSHMGRRSNALAGWGLSAMMTIAGVVAATRAFPRLTGTRCGPARRTTNPTVIHQHAGLAARSAVGLTRWVLGR